MAKSLKLSVSLKPVSKGPELYDEGYTGAKYIIPKFYGVKSHPCTNSDHLYCTQFGDSKQEKIEAERFEVMKEHFGREIITDEGVTWCQDPEQKLMELVFESTEYGNEPAGCDVYQAAAFLIQVPEFTSGRGF